MRGVAIVLVMLLHFGLAYGFRLPLPAAVPTAWVHAVLVSGNYGVSMFFVVSGFLITSNVLRRYGSLEQVEIKSFYRLRLFRLAPLLLVMLAIVTALWAAGLPTFQNMHHKQPLPGWFQWLAIFSVLTFWHNVLIEVVGDWFNYAMNICWSLSVEEVFYLAFPLLIHFVRSRRMLLLVAWVFIMAGPMYRWVHRDDENYFLYGYLACFDQISIGCLAACIAPRVLRYGSNVCRAGCAFSAFALAYFYLRGFSGHEALGFTCVAAATSCVLVCATGFDVSKSVRRFLLPLSWVGSRSYELYLFHLIVLGGLLEIWPRSSIDFKMKLPLMGLFFLLSLIVAALAAGLVGNPLNRYLRRRYSGGKSRGPLAGKFLNRNGLKLGSQMEVRTSRSLRSGPEGGTSTLKPKARI